MTAKQIIYRTEYLNKFKLKKLEIKDKIKIVANGDNHIVLVTNKDEIFGYGSNEDGQLGMGEVETVRNLTRIDGFGNIKTIECGDSFTIIVNEDNEIYASGLNYFGIENQNSLKKFTKINPNNNLQENIISIRCGFNFLYLITDNNGLYGIGSNFHGQLNLTHYYVQKITKIEHQFNIKDIQCGKHHAILLDNSGRIFGIGYNKSGQLGCGNNNNLNKFTKINLNFKVKKVACNPLSTLIINEFNELFGTGDNEYGQLGLGYTQDRNIFTKITLCGGSKDIHIFKSFGNYNVIVQDGSLYGTGDNMDGQLGIKSKYCKKEVYLDKFAILKRFATKLKCIHLSLFFNNIILIQSNYSLTNQNLSVMPLIQRKLIDRQIHNTFIDVSIQCRDYVDLDNNKKKRKIH